MSVYFVKSRDTGYIKIGCSEDVKRRFTMLGIQTGDKSLELLKVLDGYGYKAEKALHEVFSEYAVGGEWFEPNDKLLSFISDGDPFIEDTLEFDEVTPFKQWVQEQGTTLKWIAKNSGLSIKQISLIARGMSVPTEEQAKGILDCLRKFGFVATVSELWPSISHKWNLMTTAERNALMAEKVMNWTLIEEVGIEYVIFDTDGNEHHRRVAGHDFCPAEAIAHAWEVVEKMVADGWEPHIDYDLNRSGTWEVCFGHNTYDATVHIGKSAPEAICLAALKAAGMEVE